MAAVSLDARNEGKTHTLSPHALLTDFGGLVHRLLRTVAGFWGFCSASKRKKTAAYGCAARFVLLLPVEWCVRAIFHQSDPPASEQPTTRDAYIGTRCASGKERDGKSKCERAGEKLWIFLCLTLLSVVVA